MNWKEAEKIKPGALVRNSWATSPLVRTGLVLDKKYEEGTRREHILCLVKDKRYILTVIWFGNGNKAHLKHKVSSWDVMVISHAPKKEKCRGRQKI